MDDVWDCTALFRKQKRPMSKTSGFNETENSLHVASCKRAMKSIMYSTREKRRTRLNYDYYLCLSIKKSQEGQTIKRVCEHMKTT